MPIPLTLIIGVGGFGSDIVTDVACKVQDDETRSRSRFISIDTELKTMTKINNKINQKKGHHVDFVQIGEQMTVQGCLDSFTYAPSYKEEYIAFPKIQHWKSLIIEIGASQRRAISKIALLYAMRSSSAFKKIDIALNQLREVEAGQNERTIYIYIVGSITGGSGAGIVLPLSMYLRDKIKNDFTGQTTSINGFFILPEIVIDFLNESERIEKAKRNAYATLRDLNAFTLKGKNKLSPKTKNKLKLYLPTGAGGKFEECNDDIFPFNWCYLFDKEITGTGTLKDPKLYITHVANVLYNRAISQMNSAVNAVESNYNDDDAYDEGINCYAGAGSSELYYPSEHVLEYISLVWAKASLKDEWTLFDQKFNDLNKIPLKPGEKRDPQSKVYIDEVETFAKGENEFAKYILDSLKNKDTKGDDLGGNKAISYVEFIEDYVGKESKKHETISHFHDGVVSGISMLNENISDVVFKETYMNLKNYKLKAIENAKTISSTLVKSLFPEKIQETVEPWANEIWIESYMMDNNVPKKRVMHPNAQRYFLYNVLNLLEEKQIELEQKKIEVFISLEGTLDRLFDRNDGGDEETIDDYLNRNLIWKLKDPRTFEYFVGEYVKSKEKIDEYLQKATSFEVFQVAIDRVRKLCEKFEDFYSIFEEKVNKIDDEIQKKEIEYENTTGKPVRYVCASKKCLNGISGKIPYPHHREESTLEYHKDIFKRIRLCSVEKQNITDEQYNDIFNTAIVGGIKKILINKNDDYLSMNVFKAMEKEAEFEGKTNTNQYLETIITEAKKLANPLITSADLEPAHIQDVCFYNPKIKRGNENFFNTHLRSDDNENWELSDTFSENKILFYRYKYCLKLDRLIKLLSNDGRGLYYKAYHDYLTDPKFKTPHLQDNWHRIMPDLDGKEVSTDRNIEALVRGLLYKKIIYVKSRRAYEISLSGSTTRLSASCLHELLDELNKEETFIDKLLDNVSDALDKSIQKGYQNELLDTSLSSFEMLEVFPRRKNLSIFEIAAIYRYNTLSDVKYNPDTLNSIIEHAIDILFTDLNDYFSEPMLHSDKFKEIIRKDIEKFKVGSTQYTENRYFDMSTYINEIKRKIVSKVGSKISVEFASEIEKLF